MKFILGNWKMNGLRHDADQLTQALSTTLVPEGTRVAVFPPFTLLAHVAEKLSATAIATGAQDCSDHHGGAFTGDIGPGMLKDAGCSYVILGHSERRHYHQESNAAVRAKAQAAVAAGLTPIICVGENLTEREIGIYLDVISTQVKASVPEKGPYIIAYEPVWAIGSGHIPTPAEITQVHKTIASVLSYATSGALAAIIYGGSVKSGNAAQILHTEGVDGVLVGGASLNVKEFQSIITATQQK